MTPLETLRALGRGDPAAARGLLPACRAQAFGAEAFGPAAIVELFARNPCPLSLAPAVVERPGTLSVCDADLEGREQAWIADLYDDRIARLWRVGGGGSDNQAEPALGFASDAFLSQDRDPVALRADDHPDLAPEAVLALSALAAAAAWGPDPDRPVTQGRAFILRALSADDRGAALVCVQGPGMEPQLALIAFRFAGNEATHARTVWDAMRDVAVRRRV